jgi:uncharacterized protein (TIGR03083 family)
VAAEIADALEDEAGRAGAFLGELGPSDWDLPTRCPPMTVLHLAVHTMRGALRIVEFLDAPPVEDEPQMDAVTYYRYDPADVGPTVVARAQKEAESRTGAGFSAEWQAAWAAAIAAARRRADDNPVVASPFGTLRLREYLRTRCVEVTIHAMDLRNALGRDPDPTPWGLGATCDVLRGLLGADLRPLGVDDLRFALLGTGRATFTGAEREMLGPLADSFPLLQ